MCWRLGVAWKLFAEPLNVRTVFTHLYRMSLLQSNCLTELNVYDREFYRNMVRISKCVTLNQVKTRPSVLLAWLDFSSCQQLQWSSSCVHSSAPGLLKFGILLRGQYSFVLDIGKPLYGLFIHLQIRENVLQSRRPVALCWFEFLSQIRGIFGFVGEDHVGKVSFPPVQVISIHKPWSQLTSQFVVLCC